MQKRIRASVRQQIARDAAAVESAQKPALQLDRPSRPRTRAWVKQEEEQEEEDKSNSAVLPNPPRQAGYRRPRAAKATSPEPRKDSNKASARNKSQGRGSKASVVAKALPAKRQTRQRPALHKQNEVEAIHEPKPTKQTTQSRGPAFATWLSQVEPVSPEELHQARGLPATHPIDSMDSKSATRETGDDESTAKTTGRKGGKLSDLKLRYRRVDKEPTPDTRLSHLRSLLMTNLPERSLGDIEELQTITRDFLQQLLEHPNDNCYPYIDDFSYNFDQGKSKMHYPIVNRRYFEADLKRCLTTNEAVLQRTIMIHIINRYWLGDMFDWNSEGLWSQPRDSRLPSRQDDEVSLPKPDLTISFTLQSISGGDVSAPIPEDLVPCISPEADPGDRCFPFLFMEVKKAGADLQEAYMANRHSASQALYNIYLWMVRAGLEDSFFSTVRVFSLVFNAQDLSVRVHRATKVPSPVEWDLGFQFDDFCPLARYTKDQACLLVQSILNDYAARELHPVLRKAFLEITGQETDRVAAVEAKRKANNTRPSSSKRARREQQSTGQSFGMSNLST